MAYQLALLEGSKAHPIYHISLLNKELGHNSMPILQLLEEKHIQIITLSPFGVAFVETLEQFSSTVTHSLVR